MGMSTICKPFGLTDRALRFAKLYGQLPSAGPTACAVLAGYSNQGRAAHVRAAELLRDPRVIRAVVHFAGLALNNVMAAARERLELLAEGGASTTYGNRIQVRKLRHDLAGLSLRLDRLDRIASTAAA